MTILSSPRNKVFKYSILIVVTSLISSVWQYRIYAKEMEVISGFAEVNNTNIYYEVMGEGHPLVLIHGGFMDRRMWDNEFKVFAKDFKVIRYDIRGYGKSATPEKPFSHIEDLFHLLKYLKIDKAYILGLSLGGQIAINFTILNPDMVYGLITAGSALNGYPYADKEKIGLKYGEIFKAAKEENLDKVADLVIKLPMFVPVESDTVITQKMRMMIKDNFKNLSLGTLYVWPSPPAVQRLSEIKVPVLVIAGDHDVTDILGVADTLVTKIKGAKKEIIKGAAHHVNMEKPDEFNRVVLEFLQGE